MAKQVFIQTPPDLAQRPRVDFDREGFDVLIEQKGYPVIYERALRCPCKDKARPGYLIDCKNCGGTGWVWINPISTKMILHSMNLPTIYRPWSIENIGTVSITARDIDHLSFMDKITVPFLIATFSQHIYPVTYVTGGVSQLFGFTVYPIKSILQIFRFVSSTQKLQLLSEGTDYSFIVNENKVLFSSSFSSIENLSFTIRYQHPVQFYVIDFPREQMMTPIIDKISGNDFKTPMPISAVGRRVHIQLDANDYQGAILLDNSV